MISPLKGSVTAVILLVVAVLGLTLPWYQVTTSHLVPQTQTYTTEVTLLTTSHETRTTFGPPQTIFTLPSPVTLDGEKEGERNQQTCCWVSQPFPLQVGVIQVNVTDCKFCSLTIGNANGFLNTTIIQLIGSGGETGGVMDAGSYVANIWNMGDFPGNITYLSIIETVGSPNVSSQPAKLTQSTIVFSTTNSTAYSRSTLPFYMIFGLAPSVAIIISLGIMAATAILVDRRNSSSRKRHRKRRK